MKQENSFFFEKFFVKFNPAVYPVTTNANAPIPHNSIFFIGFGGLRVDYAAKIGKNFERKLFWKELNGQKLRSQ